MTPGQEVPRLNIISVPSIGGAHWSDIELRLERESELAFQPLIWSCKRNSDDA
jgi:hypothetical protein